MSRSFYASGNISPSCAVKLDTAHDGQVLQSTDGSSSHGDASIGVAQEGTHGQPLGSLDDGYAAIAELELMVYTEGDECFIRSGAAFTAGQPLKADSSGRGIAATSSGDLVFAEALQTATAADQLIKCKITSYRTIP